jgi:methylphosphotriester-DNA--protein-cysteine methyltransferase
MKRRLIFIGVISCLLLLISITLFAADYKYVSSKYSMEYHRPTCKKARKIDPLIKVTYKTAKEALDAGKQPCRVCNPPTKDSFLEGVLQNF